MFWPDGRLMARITVKEETKKDAENLVRLMIGDRFLDDGLLFVEKEKINQNNPLLFVEINH